MGIDELIVLVRRTERKETECRLVRGESKVEFLGKTKCVFFLCTVMVFQIAQSDDEFDTNTLCSIGFLSKNASIY